MIPLPDLLADAAQTALRMVPWPTEPGLRSVGSPDRGSPVLITGNYDLTVRRLMRALDGVDAWIVVAPSSGINVWCAAAGGHLGTHQVVTALKTSGIEEQVVHRRAILPQLAATGVVAREISRRCGWRVRFGPVHAEDLVEYLARGEKKTDPMRRVRFGPQERIEMAAAWGVPSALVFGLVAALLRPAWLVPIVLWPLLLALAVFFVYDRLGTGRRLRFAGAAVAIAGVAVAWAGGGTSALLAALGYSALLALVLTYDHAGSTPIEGSSHFDNVDWRIALDPERCKGVYSCWEVCPEACFEKRDDVRKIELAHDERCVRCGACVVQCPKDALFFETEGRRIEPETVRRFKLNLLGTRSVPIGSPERVD